MSSKYSSESVVSMHVSWMHMLDSCSVVIESTFDSSIWKLSIDLRASFMAFGRSGVVFCVACLKLWLLGGCVFFAVEGYGLYE